MLLVPVLFILSLTAAGIVAVACFLSDRVSPVRTLELGCDFETACQLCLRSLNLFENHLLLENEPGRYLFGILNNPAPQVIPSGLVPKGWW